MPVSSLLSPAVISILPTFTAVVRLRFACCVYFFRFHSSLSLARIHPYRIMMMNCNDMKNVRLHNNLKRCRSKKQKRGRISLRIDRKAAAMLWCTQICVCDGKERRISNDGKSSAEREKYLRKSYKTFLSFLRRLCVRAACLRLWEHLKNRKEDLNDEAERNFHFFFCFSFYPPHPKQTTSIYIDSNRLPFVSLTKNVVQWNLQQISILNDGDDDDQLCRLISLTLRAIMR